MKRLAILVVAVAMMSGCAGLMALRERSREEKLQKLEAQRLEHEAQIQAKTNIVALEEGMDGAAVLELLGDRFESNVTRSGGHTREQLVYFGEDGVGDDVYVYLEDGFVTGWQY